ncbi:MAG: hypothetical protein CME62_12440 [Halobacteriovoraceae bacterium]|nr:hypothetical protein [Halobacteriovoraceae bacterium]|tara:strand:- start:1624 stop:2250 length:627 start_codon:yes stop_codon:yes gene_type:complete
MICSFCNSENVFTNSETTSKKLFNGEQVSFLDNFFECADCGESFYEGSLLNDNNFLEEKKNVISISTKSLISRLKDKVGPISSIERVFDIPPRTFNRWKNDGASSGAYVFLSFLDHLPWLFDVAAHKFNKEKTERIIVRQAGHILNSRLNGTGAELFVDSIVSSKEFGELTVRWNKPSVAITNKASMEGVFEVEPEFGYLNDDYEMEA